MRPTQHETRPPHVLYENGQRRPGRGPRTLMTIGALAIFAVLAADAWIAHLPVVLYREPWILQTAAVAGMVLFVAGMVWLPLPALLRRRRRP